MGIRPRTETHWGTAPARGGGSLYNQDMTIAIIGAGASGMVAALQAAWHGAQVTLFERNSSGRA